MILGYISWVVPGMIIPGNFEEKLPLTPATMTDSDKAFFYMEVCLIGSGLFLGILDPKRGALWGAATGLPMVILSFIEGALNLASHNIWFIEVFVYALYTLPAVFGGLLGTFIRWLIPRIQTRYLHH